MPVFALRAVLPRPEISWPDGGTGMVRSVLVIGDWWLVIGLINIECETM